VTPHVQPPATHPDPGLLPAADDPRPRFPPQGVCGPISYYKRYRMEVDLDRLPEPALPPGYHWLTWAPGLIETHAEVLYRCFRGEIDSVVFASLGDRDGCRALMVEIVRKSGFLPGATWLLACDGGYCGTVQGIRERSGLGAIQNLGMVPDHRGSGLGTRLLLRALAGFRQAGLARATLEVTAGNERAIALYRRLGFRRTKTVYKAVPTRIV
jgi:GNAT superfamily N-acetyltransferase